ncbi:MAG TPA: hypothetical protein VLT82_12880 [Myxococcaceae bacterium]|nr:hypothetical protein [Myxococcaceae bacterium]
MTERDAAWMARLLARIRESLLRAPAAEARLTDPRVADELTLVVDELTRVPLGRRGRILRRWLLRLSSLTDAVLERSLDGTTRVCVTDRAGEAGLGPPPAPVASAWTGSVEGPERPMTRGWARRSARRCRPQATGWRGSTSGPVAPDSGRSGCTSRTAHG